VKLGLALPVLYAAPLHLPPKSVLGGPSGLGNEQAPRRRRRRNARHAARRRCRFMAETLGRDWGKVTLT
jgi:hypothetical protein